MKLSSRRPATFLIACALLALITSGSKPAGALKLQEPSRVRHRDESPARQLAKEENEEQNEFKHSSSVQFISRITGLSIDQSYWLGMAINFAIVAGILAWVSRKCSQTIFPRRTAMIQKAMEEARRTSADANRRLAEIESRLAKLDGEISAMRAAAEKESAEEEQRIKTAADEDARKIIDSVGQEITAAVRAARRELTGYAADLAVALATKQIHVDAASDQTLVRHFAGQLSNGEKSKKSS
jgi:F-type H+-transporting ATPase subunit b